MHRLSDIAMRQRVSLVQRMSSTLQKRVSTPSRVNTLGYEAFTTLDPIQTHRQQHQLASLDHSHREAMEKLGENVVAVNDDNVMELTIDDIYGKEAVENVMQSEPSKTDS